MSMTGILKRLLREEPKAPQETPREALYRQFAGVSFGDGVQIIGLNSTKIGDGTCIGDHCWLNDCVRDGTERLVIGQRALIGRRSMLSTAGKLEIGDFCLFGPDCFVSDADHVFDDLYQPILQQGATMGSFVTIEENCWLGIGVRVFGGVAVGRGSIVGAGAIVRATIPPFCVAVGAPARIVKVYDFGECRWVSVTAPGELERCLAGRETAPAPSREEYRKKLHENNHLGRLGPELAGAEISM